MIIVDIVFNIIRVMVQKHIINKCFVCSIMMIVNFKYVFDIDM